ncbi:MAG TPA: hypothetical protein VHF05_01300 [Candidatus Paceibacterota bacterium]|nr:hypothetical protein [Candidatus Paceibacterota bacterium]
MNIFLIKFIDAPFYGLWSTLWTQYPGFMIATNGLLDVMLAGVLFDFKEEKSITGKVKWLLVVGWIFMLARVSFNKTLKDITIAYFRPTTAMEHGNSVLAYEAFNKLGKLTPDLKYAQETYFRNTPVMLAVGWCESSGQQFDSNGNPTSNPKSTSLGLYQVLRGTSAEIGRQEYHLTQEDWEAWGEKKFGYDRTTLEGNLRSADWLYQHLGLTPWESSRGCWDQVAKLQIGTDKENLAAIQSSQLFGGAAAEAYPYVHDNVPDGTIEYIVHLTAPTGTWSQWYTIPRAKYSFEHTCAMEIQPQGEPAFREIDPENGGPTVRLKFGEPSPVRAKRIRFASGIDKPIEVTFSYFFAPESSPCSAQR